MRGLGLGAGGGRSGEEEVGEEGVEGGEEVEC